MKRVTKTFYISTALILVFSFALLASAYALSKAPTEEREYTDGDFVDDSLFDTVEKKENIPVAQADMKAKFGIYDHASEKTGENGQKAETLRLFSKDQASELNSKRQSGVCFVLSYDEIIFLINDSIQKYFKYDKILLTNAKAYDIKYNETKYFDDTDIDCYHGDFSELPCYAASDKYMQMISDIYDIIVYRITLLLDSSFFMYGKTLSGLYPTKELEAMRPEKIKNAPSIQTKEDAYHASLNTIDYFETAEGRFTYRWGGDEFDITFATDMINNTSYQHFKDSKGNDLEEYLTDGKFLQYNNKTKMFKGLPKIAVKKEDSAPLDDDKRLVKEPPDGTPTMYYRADPTNISQSCVSLFPQAMTVGLLGDFSKWDLARDTEGTPVTVYYAERACRVIEGKANYQGIKRFTLYVDTQTGVWLYCKGIGVNDNIVFSLETEYFKDDYEVKTAIDSEKYMDYKENTVIE